MTNNQAKIRNNKMKSQNGLCYYCFQPMWLTDLYSYCNEHKLQKGRAQQLQCTAEHLTAQSEGGKTNKENIVAACKFCNLTRHKSLNPLPPDKFIEKVKSRIKVGKWHGVCINNIPF